MKLISYKILFLNKLKKFITANFNISLAKDLVLIGRQRITAIFVIKQDNTIGDIRVKASHIELENEMKRAILKLPPLVSGVHNGKKVNVSYALPFIFIVED